MQVPICVLLRTILADRSRIRLRFEDEPEPKSTALTRKHFINGPLSSTCKFD